MADYALYCRYCSKYYFTREQWNQHLIQDSHQIKAVKQLIKWTNNDKKRALIVYTSGKLVDRGRGSLLYAEVVRWLEGNGRKQLTYVTDLVLSPRDCMAIFQLETRKNVFQILNKLDTSTVRIGNQMIQLKALGKLLELEWRDLLKRFLDVDGRFAGNGNPQPKVAICTGKLHAPQPCVSKASPPLSSQFHDVLQAIEIPEQETKLVNEVIGEVKRLLGKTVPNCEVGIFRNNLMGLRNNSQSSTYLLFMYNAEDNDIGFQAFTREMQLPVLTQFGNTSCGERPSILHKLKSIWPRDHPAAESRLGTFYLHPVSGIQLRLITLPLCVIEYQLSRLLTYYTYFDLRVKPLFTLLYFWMKENRIKLGERIVSKRSHFHLPDPVALEWLLLFYLYHEEKIVPVPKEILDRPHKPLVFGNKNPRDYGFAYDDVQFANQWRQRKQQESPSMSDEELVESVIQIFMKFCQFCTNTLQDEWGIYLGDGVLFRPEAHEHDENGCQFCALLKKESILLIHTLVETYRFSVGVVKWRNVVLPAMKQTAKKLELFIQKWKNHEPSELLKDALTVIK